MGGIKCSGGWDGCEGGGGGGGGGGGIHGVNVALPFSHLFSTSAPCPLATSGTISQDHFNTKFLLDK